MTRDSSLCGFEEIDVLNASRERGDVGARQASSTIHWS